MGSMRYRIGGLGLCWFWGAELVRDVEVVLAEVVRGAEVARDGAFLDELAGDARGLQYEAAEGVVAHDAEESRHWKVAAFVSCRPRQHHS